MTGWNKRRVLAAFLLFGSGVAATLLVLMVGSMVFAGSRAQLVPAHDMSNYAIEMEPESDELVLDDRFAMAEEASGAPGRSEGGGSLKIIQGSTNEPSRSQTKEAEKKQGLSKEEGGQEGQVRSWFPESFLWQPVVITDATGTATVEVQVPDQLTTWRVLGLAHSPEGRQAGAVHTFNSRLPVYVDPVVPAWLYVGDALDLPVQVVNMTDAEARLTLTAEGSGALVGGGEQSMVLGPSDTDRTAVRLVADSAGLGGVGATLTSEAGNDEARRQVPVLPVGRPVQRTRGGSLASARQFVLKGPAAADPATQALSVRVYPGPLAVFQSEVERLQGGAQPADGAYGFALSARMSALGAATGVELDTNAIRTLQLLAWQRIVQDTRSPNAGRASDLLASMAGVSSHPLVDGLRPRLVSAVVQGLTVAYEAVAQDDPRLVAMPKTLAPPADEASGAILVPSPLLHLPLSFPLLPAGGRGWRCRRTRAA